MAHVSLPHETTLQINCLANLCVILIGILAASIAFTLTKSLLPYTSLLISFVQLPFRVAILPEHVLNTRHRILKISSFHEKLFSLDITENYLTTIFFYTQRSGSPYKVQLQGTSRFKMKVLQSYSLSLIHIFVGNVSNPNPLVSSSVRKKRQSVVKELRRILAERYPTTLTGCSYLVY